VATNTTRGHSQWFHSQCGASHKNVVASAAESEVGACFQNAQSGAPLRVTLTELGHIQPATPLRTDNSTVLGILNETIKQKRSKAIGMRYRWLTDRVRQQQFDVYWRPKNSTPFNPQFNGIIERVHLALNDALRTAEVDGREIHGDNFYPLLHMQYAIHYILH
jgi:hypothetical protein